MKKLVLFTLLVMQVVFARAQQTPALKGKVVDSKTQKALQNVVATIQSTNQSTVTNALGEFVFTTAAEGNQVLLIRSSGYLPQTFNLEIKKGETLDIGVVVLEEDVTTEQRLALVVITDNDLGDDNSGSESTSGLLQASRDTYQQSAAFNWGTARFQIRGLDNQYGTTMINGVVMNKLYDGRPQWSNWGGLNDAIRNQEYTMGSGPSDYTFGGILGTQQISTRASFYRPGARISFSSTNTNYSWRSMGTYASGLNSKGWAFVVSGSRRWAEEGYFDGTDYGANSLFASVEKRINDYHSINFTSIYAQNSRGKNSPNTAEVTDMAGVKYNAYWGWQDGKKRNSRDKDVQEPILMLSHYWKLNEKTSLNTNVAFQAGTIGNSRIDFQGVNSPDPTYYRNLPSYYLSQYNNDPDFVNENDPSAYLPGGLGGIHTPDALSASDPSIATFLDPNKRQMNWDGMYDANSKTDGGNSVYVLYEDRTDDTQWTANSILNSQIAENITLNAGGTFRHLKSHNHKYLLDLLGGDFYRDINTFGSNENQFESDLNNPGRIVGEGDSYGYNYNLYATAIDGFTQFKFTYRKFDFYLAQSYVRSEYQREGLYRNGYYPANSFGNSRKIAFDNFGFKGGLTYKLSGNHLFTFNGVRMSKAPTIRNTFPNARVNNNIVPGLRSEIISSADVSYILRTPKVKARLTAFYAKTEDATETSFFFADGVTVDDGNPDTVDESSNFVAETVTGIDRKNIGAEFGIEYQLTSTIKAMASASYGEYTYDNNPNVILTVDELGSNTNQAPITNYGEAKLKNYFQPGMPQKAASFGLEYRDPHFWWIGTNVNYLADRYIDIAPILRTDNFFRDPSSMNGAPFPEATEERARQLLKQEKFEDLTLVNLTGGKSWKIGKQLIGFFASVNNLFDITYKTGGYEQARNASYRELNQDVSSGTPAFGPKYFYGYGRTYFVNLYINF